MSITTEARKLQEVLRKVANRSYQLNDPELNGYMVEMGLYQVPMIHNPRTLLIELPIDFEEGYVTHYFKDNSRGYWTHAHTNKRMPYADTICKHNFPVHNTTKAVDQVTCTLCLRKMQLLGLISVGFSARQQAGKGKRRRA